MDGIASARRTVTRPPWFDDADAIGGAADLLFDTGVPEHFIGRRFRLDDEVAMIDTANGSVLRLGTTGQSAAVGVDTGTGHVVEILATPDARRLFVNTSLADFVDTLEAVAGRFPFYDTDDDEAAIEAASDDVLDIVRRIDPPAAEPDCYWSTFVDDMRIGDLSTEGVLDERGRSDDESRADGGTTSRGPRTG